MKSNKVLKNDSEIASSKSIISNHEIYIDLLKILACFLVIVNHTNSKVFLTCDLSKTWYISIIVFIISKIGVPLFFLTSGAVLLKKQDDLKKTLKRIFRMIFILISFSAVVYIFNNLNDKDSIFNLKRFLFALRDNTITEMFWYLYTYIIILILLPLLQKLTLQLKEKDYIYIITLFLLIPGLIKVLTVFVPVIRFNYYMQLPNIAIYTALFLTGHYFNNYVKKDSKCVIISFIVLLVSLLFTLFATRSLFLVDSSNYLLLDDVTMINTTLIAISTFYIFKYLFKDINDKSIFGKSITFKAKYTFIIYLLSQIAIDISDNYYSMYFGKIHSLILVFLQQLFVFAFGLVIGIILKAIPGLKKLL